jgi:hypothetical protein
MAELPNARKLGNRATDSVSVKDFGAVADTVHTPTLSGADPTNGTHVPPAGTDNTQAFIDAFAAHKVVRVPKSEDGKWYTLKAGIGTAAGHDGLHIPDGGVLIVEGDILIDSRYDEMGWTGATPNVPANGSSFGMTYIGDCVINGGGKIDGGSQYTGVQSTAKEEFTYMRTVGPETTVTTPSTFRGNDIRYLNACGSHVTGGTSTENHTVILGLNHFGDYRDHAVYYTSSGQVLTNNNIVVGLKTTTTRSAFKSGGDSIGVSFDSNGLRIPNGIAIDMTGGGTGKSNGLSASNNSIESKDGIVFHGAALLSGLGDLTIEGNTIRTTGYCIRGGDFGSNAANVEELIIRDNNLYQESGGIPVYLSSGSTLTTNNDAGFKDREISTLVFEDNHIYGTTTQAQLWLYGTFPYAKIKNNEFLGTGINFPIRIGGFDDLEPNASFAFIGGNTFTLQSAQAAVEFAGTALWGSVADIPWSLSFGENNYLGSVTRYLIQVGAAPSTLISGTMKLRTQFDDLTTAGPLTGSTLSAATIEDKVERVGTTAQRPTDPVAGTVYNDTTLGYQVVYNGANWKNGIGTTV